MLPGLTIKILRSAHAVHFCVLYGFRGGKKPAVISLYNVNWLVFIIEMKSVYCAVRTWSLKRRCYLWSLKG